MSQITDLGWNAIAFGLLLTAVGALGWHRRLRVLWALLLLGGAIGLGLGRGILVVSDLWLLPLHADLVRPLLLVAGWAAFGVAARLAGPLHLPGPPIVIAPLAGALLGELPAAALLSTMAADRSAAARLSLAAAAGGLLGRVGDPALLLLGEGRPIWTLIPLALACAVVASPRPEDLQTEPGSLVVTAVAATTALAALVPALTLPALGAGIVTMAVLGREQIRELRPAPLTWTLFTAALALCGVAAGLPEGLALGIEQAGGFLGDLATPAVAAAAALISTLLGGSGSAVLLAATLDRALSLRGDELPLAMMAGCAMGGLGPLVVAGALREGWRRWLGQIALTVVFVSLL